jgi:hypothetical protein
MNDYEFEGEENPFDGLFEAMREREEIAKKLEKIRMEDSEEAERKILMGFWKEVGDHSSTYYEAIKTMEAFSVSLRSCRKKTRALSPAMRVLIFKTLVKCLDHDMKTIEKIEEEIP